MSGEGNSRVLAHFIILLIEVMEDFSATPHTPTLRPFMIYFETCSDEAVPCSLFVLMIPIYIQFYLIVERISYRVCFLRIFWSILNEEYINTLRGLEFFDCYC